MSVALLALVHCFGQHSKHYRNSGTQTQTKAQFTKKIDFHQPGNDIIDKGRSKFFSEVVSEETNNCECQEKGKSVQIFVFVFCVQKYLN